MEPYFFIQLTLNIGFGYFFDERQKNGAVARMANKSLSLPKVNFNDDTVWTKGREKRSENVMLQAKCHDDNVNGKTCNLHIIRMEHANAKSFLIFASRPCQWVAQAILIIINLRAHNSHCQRWKADERIQWFFIHRFGEWTNQRCSTAEQHHFNAILYIARRIWKKKKFIGKTFSRYNIH